MTTRPVLSKKELALLQRWKDVTGLSNAAIGEAAGVSANAVGRYLSGAAGPSEAVKAMLLDVAGAELKRRAEG
jgi:transcriptional regulator with XRE-family HTH domain